MNILAMDTTTKKANVTLLYNNNVYSSSIDNEITHSEKFLPLIDEILLKANTTLADIDLYAVTTGPGSFTGIRIGLASVKAFAKVYNKPIFALTSLELLAMTKADRSISNKYIVPCMDAKNSRIYYTIYKVNIKDNTPCLENVIDEFNDSIDIANAKICEYFKNIEDAKICVTGDIAETLSYALTLNATFQNSVLDTVSILDIIQNEIKLNGDILKSKYIKDYLNLDATYMRGSEAERTKYGEQ